MTQQPATEKEQSFFRNDRRLVCSMLLVYGLCILGLIAATFWGLNRRQLTLSANATSTAFALATQNAKATTTAVAHATELAQYELIDTFNTNKNKWRVRTKSSEYWDGSRSIQDGVYLWEVTEVKKTFISWADFSGKDYIKDFDVYVDTKVAEGKLGDVCSGFLFRISLVSWSEQYYYFSLCNNSIVKISYHSEADGWEGIAAIPYFGHADDWNRLEINARGQHFKFFINGEKVYEMDDDRLEAGSLALVMELNEKNPVKVLFDNFGFQSR